MLAFFCALPHDISSTFVNSLEQYLDPNAPYLIGLETSNGSHADTSGQHYHICASMNLLQYDAFRKTILVKKYKLNGQATKGHSRQYGKEKQIRDETKMLQYTVKDKNIIYKNIDLKTIQQLICDSYPKTTNKSKFDKLMDHLTTIPNKYPHHYEFIDKIEDEIIKYYIDKEYNKTLSKNYLKSLVIYFIMYKSKTPITVIKTII